MPSWGAQDALLPAGFARAVEVRVQQAVARSKLMAWAVGRISSCGQWDTSEPNVAPRAPARPPPQVKLIDHDYVPDGQGVHCVRCNASAQTETSKR